MRGVREWCCRARTGRTVHHHCHTLNTRSSESGQIQRQKFCIILFYWHGLLYIYNLIMLSCRYSTKHQTDSLIWLLIWLLIWWLIWSFIWLLIWLLIWLFVLYCLFNWRVCEHLASRASVLGPPNEGVEAVDLLSYLRSTFPCRLVTHKQDL